MDPKQVSWSHPPLPLVRRTDSPAPNLCHWLSQCGCVKPVETACKLKNIDPIKICLEKTVNLLPVLVLLFLINLINWLTLFISFFYLLKVCLYFYLYTFKQIIHFLNITKYCKIIKIYIFKIWFNTTIEISSFLVTKLLKVLQNIC